MTKVEVINPATLDSKELNRYRSLSFRSNGSLSSDLTYVYWHVPKGRILSIKDDNGKILSWALIYPRSHVFPPNSKYTGNWDFGVYTRHTERRKGHAKRLHAKAVKIAGGKDKLVVHPHDYTSSQFFGSVHSTNCYHAADYY